MENKYIAVKVFGNPNSNAGGMPLIVCNNPLIEIKDEAYEGMGGNSYFFAVRIEPGQVVYKIVKNRVRSYGAMREGALQIAFSIPKGYKLDGGYSPFEVLVDLKDTFLNDCMNCRDSVAETYEFKQGDVSQHALDAAARKYTLFEAGSPWHVMPPSAPKGCVVLPEDKIQEFMHDVQYAEFEKCSEVLVAESVSAGASYQPIVLPSVPRKPDYCIIVDNTSRQKTNNPDEQVKIIPNGDSRYYELTPISFSIGELLNGGSRIEGVEFDGATETVKVSTAPYKKPREFKIHVAFTPSENEAAIYSRKGQITIRYNGQKQFLTNDFMFTVSGEEYRMFDNLDGFTIDAPESVGYTFGRTPTFDSLRNELSWHTEKIVKKTPKATGVVPVARKAAAAEKAASVSEMFDVVVRVENTEKNKKFLDKARHNGKLVVRNLETGYEVSRKGLSFSMLYQPKTPHDAAHAGKRNADIGKSYSCETIKVPKPELGYAKYGVTIWAAGENFTANVPNANDANNGRVELDFTAFQKVNKSAKDSIVPNRFVAFVWGLLLGALLVGGAWGIKSFQDIGKTDPAVTQADSTGVAPMQQDAGATAMTDEEIKKQLDDFDSTLKNKKDLSFDEVSQMYNACQANAQRYEAVGNEVCQRINDYEKVASLIQHGDYDGIAEEMEKGNGLHMYALHRNCVALITNGFGSKSYNVSERKTAKSFFMNSYTSYTKFTDLNGIKDLFPPQEAPKPDKKESKSDKKESKGNTGDGKGNSGSGKTENGKNAPTGKSGSGSLAGSRV